MSVFQLGDFTLASGQEARWKIECDALDGGDWAALAFMLNERVNPFREVFGVPRGGIPLANAMRKYVDIRSDRLLVVDDVWTTGGSIRKFSQELARDRSFVTPVDEAVVFARGAAPYAVEALFRMAS